MRDSDTYMAILDEGRDEGRTDEARRILLRLGRKRFGEPLESAVGALKTITDIDRLERMSDRVLDASSWQELLDTP